MRKREREGGRRNTIETQLCVQILIPNPSHLLGLYLNNYSPHPWRCLNKLKVVGNIQEFHWLSFLQTAYINKKKTHRLQNRNFKKSHLALLFPDT